MLDAEKLREMKNKHILSEEDLVHHKHRLASKVVGKVERKSAANGIVYILSAFFLGTIGIHNFYAGYWKRGLVQLCLTVMAQYMLYIPLLFTSLWAEMELLFVNKTPDGRLFKGSRRVIWLMRLMSVVALVWGMMSFTSTNFDTMFQLLDEMYGVVDMQEIEQIENV